MNDLWLTLLVYRTADLLLERAFFFFLDHERSAKRIITMMVSVTSLKYCRHLYFPLMENRPPYSNLLHFSYFKRLQER